MKLIRSVALAAILLTGITLITVLYIGKVETSFMSSLAPFFQIMGEPVRAVDVAATKVLPIDEFDEKEYGDCIASFYSSRADSSDSNYMYLNSLLKTLTSFSNKPFTYRAFVMHLRSPNACALPGGIILVTEGLLDILETEGGTGVCPCP